MGIATMSRRSTAVSLQTLALVVGLLVATMGASTVRAAPLFTVGYEPGYGSTGNTGATASVDFTFTDQASGVLLTLGISNTTDGSQGLGATAATLVGLTFDFPTSDPFTYDGGTIFPTLYTPGSLPPYGTFDVCIRSTAQGGTCVGGNPNAGLTTGQSTTVSFLFDTPWDANDLGNLFLTDYISSRTTNQTAARFQQVNIGGADKVLGGGVTSTNAVPEPPTLALLGVAVAGVFGFTARRRQPSAQNTSLASGLAPRCGRQLNLHDLVQSGAHPARLRDAKCSYGTKHHRTAA